MPIGAVTPGVPDGDAIAPGVGGSPKQQKEPAEFAIAAPDEPRVAYVKWAGEFHLAQRSAVEGVTRHRPDPDYALVGSLK